MGIFSIKDIEAVSGIKCHTLRIWEQRYNILCPKRTGTNIRYYDDDDLKFILNISILNKYGYKISCISKMSREEVSEAILKISGDRNEYYCQVKEMVKAMMVFDEGQLYRILCSNITAMGLEPAMQQVVFPFLREVGLLWQTGSIQPAHEHFATQMIKQKLFAAIDKCAGKYAEGRKRFLLFLPEHEQHSLGLLFANYILRARGHEVLYLGQEVSVKGLEGIYADYLPDYVFTLLTCAHIGIDRQQFVEALAGYRSNCQVLLSGSQFIHADDLRLPENVRIIPSAEALVSHVEAIPAGR